MNESRAFTAVSETLEELGCLSRLESRGTVRIALKRGGLSAYDVTASELSVVVEQLFPEELTARGVDDVTSVVDQLLSVLRGLPHEATPDSPEASLRRLWGR